MPRVKRSRRYALIMHRQLTPLTGSSTTARRSTRVHPNGEAKIHIVDVEGVYGPECDIPLRAYKGSSLRRPKLSSMVAPDEVQRARDRARARDQADGLSVLEDIDTQWGALPGGGALLGYNDD